MDTAITDKESAAVLTTLPSDEVRQIMWRFADRFDLQMAVQSTRATARGPVARLVADGARLSHEWTEQKGRLLTAFDQSGITSVYVDPEDGGYLEGPKNLAMALIAFELAWVDGGAATTSLAVNLALAPIQMKGTAEQKRTYMRRCVPPQPGEERTPSRGAFCLTEPLPYVGVDTGVLAGKARVVEWNEGEEPILQIDKRGRFITNMDFANFVVVAVGSDDERIKGSCLVVLEESDPGTFDRGAPTHKLVHQLSSTCDPIFSQQVPASRIVGGYTVEDGVIVPRYSHSKVLETIFSKTRVPVGAMTAAKLLSAVEPVIRYQRGRFRGGEGAPGTPRYESGLQMKEDVLHRLVDVWATGEACASLAFATARHFDEFEGIENNQEEFFAAQGIKGARAQMRARREAQKQALEYLKLAAQPEAERDQARYTELGTNRLVEFLIGESLANVLSPATKLWNTGHGANVMREAVSLMGGYGITEDCPGFLGQKWMDAQLEATYEGPEAVQRRQLIITMTDELFLAQFKQWVREMREIAGRRPGTGACNLASAMDLWAWTLKHLQQAKDANGKPIYRDKRQGATFPMADALCWLVAARYQILDAMELEKKGADNPVLAEALPGLVQFFTDLCHVQAARAAGEVGRICASLVFGYNRHPLWDKAGCDTCYTADELDSLEAIIPGFSAGVRGMDDVIETDGSHPNKAGPCVKSAAGVGTFKRLRDRLDGCLTGGQLAKDRAARALTEVMIPEALDYPA